MHPHIDRIRKFLRTTTGVLLSVAAALLASLIFSGRQVNAILPLAFVVLLVLLSARFGVAVSVIGSAFTAIIFAHFIYAPVGSWRIDSAAERANIAWMILGAICLSYLLFPSAEINKRKR